LKSIYEKVKFSILITTNNLMPNHSELEKTLWQAADKHRNNMDAAEYKHVVLGLIFLKYISDAFEELYQKLKDEEHETGANPEDKDEYIAERVFYAPPYLRRCTRIL
jgi:type I restriction enzyme M protein